MKSVFAACSIATGLILAGLSVAGAAAAHCSFAIFDQTRRVVLQATVVEFQWTNPHAILEVVAPGASGAPERWSIEMNGPNNLKRQGWHSNFIKPGDKVSLTINPMRNGQRAGLFQALVMPDGRVLGDPSVVRSALDRARSSAGV